MNLRLTTFGGLSGSSDQDDLEWLGSKWLQTGLLTYLTVERSATRDALLALFWPESDADTAGHRLNQTVYSLRRTLGEACIESKGHEIRASAALVADTLEFTDAIDAGRFQAAIELYGGPFLAGVHLVDTTGFETWVDTRRARHAREFRSACRSLVDDRVTAGDISGALATARAWIGPDPVDDEAQHRLIELLAISGQRTQALKQYASYTKLLEVDGLEPLDQTREFVASLEGNASPGAFSQLDAAPVAGTLRPSTAVVGTAANTARVTAGLTAPGQAGRAEPIDRARPWPGIVGIVGVGLLFAVALWAIFSPRMSEARPFQSLGLAILLSDAMPEDATSLARAIEPSLSARLAGLSELRVVSSQTIGALNAGGVPRDSIAMKYRLDYIIDMTVERSEDSVALTLNALLGGIEHVRSVHVRAYVPTIMAADSVGVMAADSLRRILGSHIGERKLSQGTRDTLAIQHFYNALQRRIRVKPALYDRAPERALAYLAQADSIFDLSHDRDPVWSMPLVQRASNAELRAVAMDASDASNAEIVDAIDDGIGQLGAVLDRWPNEAIALAWRGRLRWRRAGYAGFSEASVDSAPDDLYAALDYHAPAWASVELSKVHFEGQQSFNEALAAAQDALERDDYLLNTAAILERMGRSHFELMRDDSASFWCGRAAELLDINPSPLACLLDIMAWGYEPAEPDSAWAIYDSIVERMTPGNSSVAIYYRMPVAGVLARAGLRDSAQAVMSQTRYPDAGTAPSLLAQEAAVWFRLGEPDSARARLDTFRELEPENLARFVRMRMLRRFLMLESQPGGG